MAYLLYSNVALILFVFTKEARNKKRFLKKWAQIFLNSVCDAAILKYFWPLAGLWSRRIQLDYLAFILAIVHIYCTQHAQFQNTSLVHIMHSSRILLLYTSCTVLEYFSCKSVIKVFFFSQNVKNLQMYVKKTSFL